MYKEEVEIKKIKKDVERLRNRIDTTIVADSLTRNDVMEYNHNLMLLQAQIKYNISSLLNQLDLIDEAIDLLVLRALGRRGLK